MEHNRSRYDYTRPGGRPGREPRPDQSKASFLKRLLVFGVVTGISLFSAEAADVVHLEGLAQSAWEPVGEALSSRQEADYQGRGKLYDTPIQPGVKKQLLTEDFGHTEIPVRSKPGQGEQLVGITLRTYLVNGEEWHGDVYPSNSAVGKFKASDGYFYGRWFKVEAVPLFEKTKSGKYVPIGVAQDMYIAENFLTLPEEQDH